MTGAERTAIGRAEFIAQARERIYERAIAARRLLGESIGPRFATSHENRVGYALDILVGMVGDVEKAASALQIAGNTLRNWLKWSEGRKPYFLAKSLKSQTTFRTASIGQFGASPLCATAPTTGENSPRSNVGGV